MPGALNPTAPDHLPAFITAPGETDVLLLGMVGVLLTIFVTLGVLYLRLHALPEHIAHRGDKVQWQIVCVLALLAMFTHNHLYWIAGLLLALIRIPDFSTPLAGIAASLSKMADSKRSLPRIELHQSLPDIIEKPQHISQEVKNVSHT